MGVFARLFRRSKATEEVSTVEAQADTPTAERETEEETAQARGPVAAPAEEVAPPATAEPTEADGDDNGDEGVEIPKQQRADESADSEAGEGAHT